MDRKNYEKMEIEEKNEKEKIIEKLKKAGYQPVDYENNQYLFEGGYREAVIYYKEDYDVLKKLSELDEKEQNTLIIESRVLVKNKYAEVCIGYLGEGKYFSSISRANTDDDDFDGVINGFVEDLEEYKGEEYKELLKNIPS